MTDAQLDSLIAAIVSSQSAAHDSLVQSSALLAGLLCGLIFAVTWKG